MESKDFNIVENSALEETSFSGAKDTVTSGSNEDKNYNNDSSDDKKDPIDPKWIKAAKKINSGESKLIETGSKRVYDEAISIDLDKYRDLLGPDIFIPEGSEGIDILNQRRSDSQAWYTQAGNMLGQAAVGEVFGGTIEGLGYVLDIGSIADLIQGDEEDFGNFLTEFGQSLREGAQDSMPIYEDPSASGLSKALDTGWWASGLVSTASTVSMLAPTMAVMKGLSFVGKGIAASRGMMALRNSAGLAAKMGRKGKWMTNGISQAIISRNIENWMEAHGTFKDMKSQKMQQIDNKTGDLYTEEEATRIASEAAAGNYGKGWAMLMQDIPQYLAIGKVFNPVSGKFVKAADDIAAAGVKSSMKPWQSKLSAAATTFFGEGGEESYQYLISEQSKLKADLESGYISQKEYSEGISKAIGSEEMFTSAFFGGLGGNLFKAIGSASDSLFKSKTQKEYEKGLEESYSHHVKNRADALRLSYQHLNSVDQSESKEVRDHIISESMLNLAVESLESDKFNQFYETLGMVSEMSEEDAESYKKETGEEFNRDLAKESAPKLQEMALKVRDKYLKHRDHHSSSTASRLSLLEMHNEKWSKNVEKSRENVKKIKSSIGSQFDMVATDRLKKRLEIRERGEVLKNRKELLNTRLEEAKPYQKPFIQSAIDNNEALLEQHAKIKKEQKEENRDRTAQQKEIDSREVVVSQDKAAEKLYNDLHKENIIEELNNEARAREQIIINNEDMAFTKSEEGGRVRKEGKIKDKMDSITKNPDKSQAIKELKELREVYVPESEILQSDKNQLYESIDKKLEELEKQIKEEEAVRISKENAKAVIKANAEKNKNKEEADNQEVVHQPVLEDSIEDYNGDDRPDASDQQIKMYEKSIKKSSKGKGFIALLDRIKDDSDESVISAYDEWNLQPINKIGEVFDYSADIENSQGEKEKDDAISDFKKLKPGDKIPQSVVDNLPIKVSLNKKSDIYTFLPTKPKDDSDDIGIDNYEREYEAERAKIIKGLINGEKMSSKVALNTGGDLNMDYDHENKRVPEYSVLDLLQIGGDLSKVQLLVTDKMGRLVNMQKKLDKDLGFNPIYLSSTSKGSRLPYAGGVFLKVRKANGEFFALRLNLKKNTKEQATLLAELLMEVGVTSPDLDSEGKTISNEKGVMKVSKKIKLSTSLYAVDPNLKERIMDIMGPEVEMLDKEYKNPTIKDLIDAFVYMSGETKGKTSALYMDGNDLKFGDQDKAITMVNRDSKEINDSFIDFLMGGDPLKGEKKKRRQFNIALWNKSENYKRFVLESGVVSTDGSITEPLFINNRSMKKTGMSGKRIQLYLAPIESKSQDNGNPTVNANGEIGLSPENPETATVATTFGFLGGAVASSKEEKKEVTPTQQAGEIEAKKADIEKRREEELKYKTLKGSLRAEAIIRGKAELGLTTIDNISTYFREVLIHSVPDKVELKFVDDIVRLSMTKSKFGISTTDFNDIKDSKEVKSYKEYIKSNINAKYDAELAALEPTQQASEVEEFIEKKPLEGVLQSDIDEMPNKNYKELVETGYTQWFDKNGEAAEASYAPTKNTPEDSDNQFGGSSQKELSLREGEKVGSTYIVDKNAKNLEKQSLEDVDESKDSSKDDNEDDYDDDDSNIEHICLE